MSVKDSCGRVAVAGACRDHGELLDARLETPLVQLPLSCGAAVDESLGWRELMGIEAERCNKIFIRVLKSAGCLEIIIDRHWALRRWMYVPMLFPDSSIGRASGC